MNDNIYDSVKGVDVESDKKFNNAPVEQPTELEREYSIPTEIQDNINFSLLKWKEAKTYAKTAPHEYVVLEYIKDDKTKEAYTELWQAIQDKAVEEFFYEHPFKYYYRGDGYKYWTYGDTAESSDLINRAKADVYYK